MRFSGTRSRRLDGSGRRGGPKAFLAAENGGQSRPADWQSAGLSIHAIDLAQWFISARQLGISLAARKTSSSDCLAAPERAEPRSKSHPELSKLASSARPPRAP